MAMRSSMPATRAPPGRAGRIQKANGTEELNHQPGPQSLLPLSPRQYQRLLTRSSLLLCCLRSRRREGSESSTLIFRMAVPAMPPKVRSFVEPRSGPVLFGVLVLAAAASGLTDYVAAVYALATAVVLSMLAMILREWVFIERNRDVGEYHRLLVGLERATASSHADYEESIDQVWYLEPDGRDRASTTYETKVLNQDSIAWRRVKLYATANLPTPTALEMGLTAVEAVAGETEAFRVKEGGGLADYVVFFRSPITEAEARGWAVTYRWPGLWDPLRQLGEDQCELGFSKPGRRGSIRLVFPADMADPPRTFLRRTPNDGTERYEDYEGRPSLVWEFGPCSPGQIFRADVRAQLT